MVVTVHSCQRAMHYVICEKCRLQATITARDGIVCTETSHPAPLVGDLDIKSKVNFRHTLSICEIQLKNLK